MARAKEMKRMDEETRKKAQAIFESLGLTEEQAIELFYKRTIAAGKMPFAAAEGDSFLRLAYGAISNNALCKNQEVDGRRRFYEPLATNHEPLSLPSRQIRCGSDRVIEFLRSERLSCEGELAAEGGLRGS